MRPCTVCNVCGVNGGKSVASYPKWSTQPEKLLLQAVTASLAFLKTFKANSTGNYNKLFSSTSVRLQKYCSYSKNCSLLKRTWYNVKAIELLFNIHSSGMLECCNSSGLIDYPVTIFIDACGTEMKSNCSNDTDIKYLCVFCAQFLRSFAKYQKSCQRVACHIVRSVLSPFGKSKKFSFVRKTLTRPVVKIHRNYTESVVPIDNSQTSYVTDVRQKLVKTEQKEIKEVKKRGRPKKVLSKVKLKRKLSGEENRNKSVCPFCDKVYSIAHSFVHNCHVYKNSLRCKKCNVFFSTYIRYEKHLETFHFEKKTMSCDVTSCNQKFVSAPALKWHLHFHSIESSEHALDNDDNLLLPENQSQGKEVNGHVVLKRYFPENVQEVNMKSVGNESETDVPSICKVSAGAKKSPLLTLSDNSVADIISINNAEESTKFYSNCVIATLALSTVRKPTFDEMYGIQMDTFSTETTDSISTLPVVLINEPAVKTICEEALPVERSDELKLDSSRQVTFRCQKCNSTFQSQLLLEQHYFRFCKLNSAQLLSLDYSEHLPTSQLGFFRHISVDHKVGNQQFECPMCSKLFTYISDLVEHINCHESSFSCKCLICAATVTNRTNFSAQLSSFECSLCAKLFSNPEELVRHLASDHATVQMNSQEGDHTNRFQSDIDLHDNTEVILPNSSKNYSTHLINSQKVSKALIQPNTSVGNFEEFIINPSLNKQRTNFVNKKIVETNTNAARTTLVTSQLTNFNDRVCVSNGSNSFPTFKKESNIEVCLRASAGRLYCARCNSLLVSNSLLCNNCTSNLPTSNSSIFLSENVTVPSVDNLSAALSNVDSEQSAISSNHFTASGDDNDYFS